MQAIVNAAQMIQIDEATRVLAGGMEAMSQAPFSIRGRDGFTLAPGGKLEDSLMVALLDSYCGCTWRTRQSSMASNMESLARRRTNSRCAHRKGRRSLQSRTHSGRTGSGAAAKF